MQKTVSKKDVQQFIGQTIYAVKKDGTTVSGKLVRISGNKIILAPEQGKEVTTSALAPLVLFDLLAIGTAPYAYGGGFYGGGFGYPYGGFYGGFW
ncbi:hypothetical protein GCM10023310_02210 [Paenibacillus vulneris]|uniref:50S ribosomal protein L33 n=1 Tax=Paenibacillus vulneris TaxID=1133364 RepID=A0ABW3UEC6_9BACL|nr:MULTISPECIES: 50S ribosomal protein L33 [unclassified Paenibacillus]MBE1445634.1 hypothetical protein [Paenibacillus sp. OAS669]